MCPNQERSCACAHLHTLTPVATRGHSPALKGSERGFHLPALFFETNHLQEARGFKQRQPTEKVASICEFCIKNFISSGH